MKHDCAFGDDLDEGEIAVVSEVKRILLLVKSISHKPIILQNNHFHV